VKKDKRTGQNLQNGWLRPMRSGTMKMEKNGMKKLTEDEKYMKQAIAQAKKAYALREVPIGCVIVHEGKVIARGYNRRNTDNNTLAHAELQAMRKAMRVLGDWRLEGCRMYITLEPCPMCAGAIVQARIPQVIVGSMNPKAGCAGSVINLLQMERLNHQAEFTKGVLEEECSLMLKQFFRELREENKKKKESIT
jgi:tRNA(adenine34) deaminase